MDVVSQKPNSFSTQMLLQLQRKFFQHQGYIFAFEYRYARTNELVILTKYHYPTA